MAEKYPKEAQNPPFQPGARPDEQPLAEKRVGKGEKKTNEEATGPIAPDEREPGSYPKDEVMAHTLDPYRKHDLDQS